MAQGTLQFESEWLEADGRGGFASGTVSGIRTRRYHALLLHASSPPTGRVVLVSGLETWVETAHGDIAISAQRYHPDVVHPDGHSRIVGFSSEPWPTWRYRIQGDLEIVQEALVQKGGGETVIRWSLSKGNQQVQLKVRPLLSGRDYHSLHHENPNFRFDAHIDNDQVTWRPYQGLPAISAISNGRYEHTPDWYRNFLYCEEQSRGLDCVEDLASPGVFTWSLEKQEAVLILQAKKGNEVTTHGGSTPLKYAQTIMESERKRRIALGDSLSRAADAYVVQRASGKTIIAGYPWFTDWGRDTFIALRGLCITRRDLNTTRDILLEWADTVSEGMLPNRFPDAGEEPEYNSVDASLWYVVAVHDFLEAAETSSFKVSSFDRRKLQDACEAIVTGYSRGTRFGIRQDSDGLLAAGVPGVQLTWMDAKIGDWVVTPRIGKPIEIQALWVNSLRIVSQWLPNWEPNYSRALEAVRARFWHEGAGYLYDNVDVDHLPGQKDASFRPNQILAVGGLPFPVFEGEQARIIVNSIEAQLLTPLGLRTLSSDDPAFRPRYEGSVAERDSAYHQGTAWPWLLGPFVEAWLRARGYSAEAKKEANERFLQPIREHLKSSGLGHISEIVDAEAPFEPRGCPFQAWSLGEFLRVQALLDAPARTTSKYRKSGSNSAEKTRHAVSKN